MDVAKLAGRVIEVLDGEIITHDKKSLNENKIDV